MGYKLWFGKYEEKSLEEIALGKKAPKQEGYTKMQCIIPTSRPCWSKMCPKPATSHLKRGKNVK